MYLIARIEPIENLHVSERELKPCVVRLSERCTRITGLGPMFSARKMLERNGFELCDRFAPMAERKNWELVAFIYTSPNKEGKGRAGSALYRRAVRRIEEEQNG